MAMTDYVTLNITNNTVRLTQPGFGTGLYLSYVAAWTERTRTYSQYTDVIADFPNTTGPEARLAAAYFGQSPSPAQLIIGRGANKPTKTVTVSAISPTGSANYTYTLYVKGDGFADAVVTYTSDGTPTDAEWASGMVTALNAVSGKNYTASGSSSPITLTGTAGAWFSVSVGDINHQSVTETTADPGVAADLTAITAENPNWYCLLTAFNSKLYGVAAAAAVEATGSRIYVAGTNDSSTVLNASTGTADLMDQCKTNAYTRTTVHYHPDPSAFYAAALTGSRLWTQPGQETWHEVPVTGVATFPMTATHRTNITARNGNSFELVAGVGVSFQGMTGAGGFIDTRRFLDWLQSTIAGLVFAAGVAAAKAGKKIPMTDPGIAVMEGQVRAGLKMGADVGGLIESTIVVTVPLAANISSQDRANRVLNNVNFSATLQGGVNKTVVNGSVTGS
jgi:hypothetical protein